MLRLRLLLLLLKHRSSDQQTVDSQSYRRESIRREMEMGSSSDPKPRSFERRDMRICLVID